MIFCVCTSALMLNVNSYLFTMVNGATRKAAMVGAHSAVQLHCTSLRGFIASSHPPAPSHQGRQHPLLHRFAASPKSAVQIASSSVQPREWLFLDKPLLWQVCYLLIITLHHNNRTYPGHLP